MERKMKRVILIMALLLAGLAWAGTPFQQNWVGGRVSGTMDSTSGDSFQVSLPPDRGKGLLMGYFWADSLKDTTEIESLNVRFRQAVFGVGDTTGIGAGTAYWPHAAAWGAAGALAPWSFAKIYKGVDQGLVNFDSAVTATDIVPYNRRGAGTGGKIPILFDMDGYPWRGMQIWIDFLGGRDALGPVSCDSIKYYFEFDID